MTLPFKFVEQVWAEEDGHKLKIELSGNGGQVRLSIHSWMDGGSIAQVTIANYRMKRIADAIAKAVAVAVLEHP